MKESDLQVMVADYLRIRYPKVLFHSDFGSGIKLTQGQAMKQKRQNGGRRGWPDMFIAEPRGYLGELMPDSASGQIECAGMFLELKVAGTRIFKKDGSPATPHIAEQLEVLRALSARGYHTAMVRGFDEAKKIIDDYLGGNNGEVEF